MATSRSNPAHRDSFSDLAILMKAKKPYTPVAPPTSKPQLSFATNRMQLTSPTAAGRSLLSPLASPFPAPETVAEFLREQEQSSASASPPSVSVFRKQGIERLDSLTDQINNYPIHDDTEGQLYPRTPSPRYQEPLHVPKLQSPIHIGPVYAPIPKKPLHTALSAEPPAEDAVVRVTKRVWDSMDTELQMLTAQKRALEVKLASIERNNESLRIDGHDVGAQIGKLRFQNEVNRDQKASMGRSLASKEVEIKMLQLDNDGLAKKLLEVEREVQDLGGVRGELEYLRHIKMSLEKAHERSLNKLTDSKHRELEDARNAICKLEGQLKHVTLERDAAMTAQTNAGDHMARAHNLAETLAKRERVVTDLRQKHLEEHMKVTNLEDEVEVLRAKVNQENIDDLKEKLREKTSQCDRLRNQVKSAELQLKASQERVLRAANDGESLQGAAHLVAPNPKGKLPKNVISCSECYAGNLPCDSNARCHNCTERNAKCARWRCSLKQKLGECRMAPCKLPHDIQGWLVSQDARPQW
ncbi:uncharacterized protein K460DRAFT_355862 [Cucurbitaria berberidis CBS 394.84]|uniref:Uncharacterized protein n=1 Tax=Cucurbitaria berberidis CBS 394.84 TaxID=1168544 RepID=A0A9P4GJ33_9PLEO|nr:uncharacterized protein K460DRAFT_355862 [Cucurbitaria berberidis CBS 394.84]KAF1846144.1 hypothetical protein K460DRAFT_355862 [Cucurbitaria berberidis CBS 394.84]